MPKFSAAAHLTDASMHLSFHRIMMISSVDLFHNVLSVFLLKIHDVLINPAVNGCSAKPNMIVYVAQCLKLVMICLLVCVIVLVMRRSDLSQLLVICKIANESAYFSSLEHLPLPQSTIDKLKSCIVSTQWAIVSNFDMQI